MSKQPVKVFDVKYESIAEAHRQLSDHAGQDDIDLGYGAVYYRVLCEDLRWCAYALDGPRRPLRRVRTRGMVVVFRGRRFRTYAAAAEYFGVNASTVRYYVTQSGHANCYLERRYAA